MQAPEIPDSLIRYLESVFPDRVADPEKINPYRAQGRADVIRHLRAVQLQQEEEPAYVPTE